MEERRQDVGMCVWSFDSPLFSYLSTLLSRSACHSVDHPQLSVVCDQAFPAGVHLHSSSGFSPTLLHSSIEWLHLLFGFPPLSSFVFCCYVSFFYFVYIVIYLIKPACLGPTSTTKTRGCIVGLRLLTNKDLYFLSTVACLIIVMK